MKLLCCSVCRDVVALSLDVRTCLCGHAKGKYVNEKRAEVEGGHILGINNSDFFDCLSKRTTTNNIRAFFVWFDPEC
jgi:hypothetical protein